jgi:hypothetical protein
MLLTREMAVVYLRFLMLDQLIIWDTQDQINASIMGKNLFQKCAGYSRKKIAECHIHIPGRWVRPMLFEITSILRGKEKVL